MDALEAKWRAEREAAIEGGYYATSYSGWLSYGTSLVTNIVENLELKIKNVHIRYEDTVTIPNYRFSFGLTIDSLQARSCDSNWIAGYMAAWNQTTASFKLVELTDMSIYWQPLHDNEALGDVGHEQLADEFDRWKAISKQYIINPVSATAKFKRDRSETPLRTRSRPRLTCDLILNEVLLTLNDVSILVMVWLFDQPESFNSIHLISIVCAFSGNIRKWLIASGVSTILHDVVATVCYDRNIVFMKHQKPGGYTLYDAMELISIHIGINIVMLPKIIFDISKFTLVS